MYIRRHGPRRDMFSLLIHDAVDAAPQPQSFNMPLLSRYASRGFSHFAVAAFGFVACRRKGFVDMRPQSQHALRSLPHISY